MTQNRSGNLGTLLAELESPANDTRVLFWKRPDGLVQFFVETLHEDEDQGQRYTIWRPEHPQSGLFETVEDARTELSKRFDWIEGRDHRGCS